MASEVNLDAIRTIITTTAEQVLSQPSTSNALAATAIAVGDVGLAHVGNQNATASTRDVRQLDPAKIRQLRNESYEVVTPRAPAPLMVKPNMGVTFISDGNGGFTPIYIRAIYGTVAHANKDYVDHDWSICDQCQTTEFQAIHLHTDAILASARAVDLTSQNYYFTHQKKFNSIYWEDAKPQYGDKKNVTLIEGFKASGNADLTEAFLKAIIQKSRYSCNGRLLVDFSHADKKRLLPQLKQMGFEDTTDGVYQYLPESARQRWLAEIDANRITFPETETSTEGKR